MKTLLFQGDSITDCGRESCGGAGYPPGLWGPGYPGLIASYLMGSQPGKWNIVNKGISGHRIVDLYARWKQDAINIKPDILSILIGVNDTLHEKLYNNGVELSRFDRFYRMLLDWSRKDNPQLKFVLMEPFVLPFGVVGEDWLDDIRARQEAVRNIASDYQAVFVPLQRIFDAALRSAPQEYWMVEGVHPQPAGQWLIADAWLKAAMPLL